MAEVKLRKDFYGTLIAKVSSDSLRVAIDFDYKGPAQTLDIETNTGKTGLWGDYDQESPAYHDSKYVSKSDAFRSYTFSRNLPLSFWGTREIDDCAAEVVIKGEGVYDDGVIWNAYTVNLVAYEIRTLEVDIEQAHMGWASTDPPPLTITNPSGENHFRDNDKGEFEKGTRVKVTAHANTGFKFKKWTDEIQGGTSYNITEYVSDNGYMIDNKAVKAHFEEGVAPPGISFQAGVAGTPAGWAGYDRWMCYYFDPGINDFVSDNQWHGVHEYLTFAGVQTGGYFAAFVMRTSDPSVCSPQYTSGSFWSADGKKYLFNVENLVVYEVA